MFQILVDDGDKLARDGEIRKPLGSLILVNEENSHKKVHKR